MSKIAFPRTLRNTDVTQLSRALDENMRYLERLLNATFEMDHERLSNITSGQHHTKYLDSEVDTIVATHAAIATAHHTKYTDSDAVTAMGAKADSNPLHHDQVVTGGSGYRESAIFTADGTFTKADYSWLTHVRVTVVAGGGGGGGTPSTAGSEWAAMGGGGAGATSVVDIAVGALGTTETVTVGVGGAGVSAAAGTDGEDSSFGTHAVADKGLGGPYYTPAIATGSWTSRPGGRGGLASAGTGDLKYDGGSADSGIGESQYNGGQDGGNGGNSVFGPGGQGGKQDDGDAGGPYGGGGGGSAQFASQGARAGGSGADGVVIVELFDKSGNGLPPFDHGSELTGLGDDDHTQYLLVDGTRELEHEAWTTPALSNSWVNFGAGEQTFRVRRDSSGNVWIQGVIKDGTATSGTTLLTLAAGYRPDGNLHLPLVSNNTAASIKINSSGLVTIRTGWSSAWASLNLVFPADST